MSPDNSHYLLKGGFTGSSESTLVKMSHCWKSHVEAHLRMYILDEPKKEEPKKKTEELDEEPSEDKENTMYPWKNPHFSVASINLLTLCLQVSSADNLCKQFGPTF